MLRRTYRAVTTARVVPGTQPGRRFASTSTSRSGTWKGSAVRWAAAGTIVYYYNTSSVFAEEPQHTVHAPTETSHESEIYKSVDSIAEQRRAQARSSLPQSPSQTSIAEVSAPDAEQVAIGGPGELEEEAEQQGAFNEETGEINWDCPCLGGMAHGPCGEQFRAAFSCFVYSKEEPKGVECIEHFKTMQNCFREHPEIYGSELDEEEVDAQLEGQQGDAPVASEPQTANTVASAEDTRPREASQRAQAAATQVKQESTVSPDEAGRAVPTARSSKPTEK